MYIERRGSEKDHGLSSTSLKAKAIKFRSKDKSVHFTSWLVSDFSTNANHDWDISITIDELRSMLEALIESAHGADGPEIVAAMSPSLSSILSLASAISQHRDLVGTSTE